MNVIKIRLSPKNKGQVIVPALVALVVLFIIAIAVIESGNLIYEKIHMQNIADSGAMEAGLWYARSLNILSLSNKILLCSAAVAGVLTILEVPEAEKIPQIVQKLQDVFAGTGGYGKWKIKPAAMMTAMLVLRNGMRNGVVDVPLFNTEEFSDQGFNPSFNVERRYIDDTENEEVTYYFDSDVDGKRYTFNQSEVHLENGKSWKTNAGCRTTNGVKVYGGPRYVIRKVERKRKSKSIPLTIEETGIHTVQVVSIKTGVKQLLSSGFLTDDKGNEIKPAFLLSTAMTTIDGGSMSIWDINGAGYTPKIRHVMLPKMQQLQTLAKLKDYLKYINILSGQASNDILLH